MTAKRIGDLIPGIMEHCAAMKGVQTIIGWMETDDQRKHFIMLARQTGFLTDEETGLLITAHGLEEA